MPARLLLDAPNLVTLPASQWNRVQQLRAKLLDHLADAADDLGASLDGDVRRTIARIKASGYKDRVIRREVKAMMRRHHGRLGKALAGQIKHAASLAGRYSEIVEAFARGKQAVKPLADYATERLLREGRATARMALAPEVLLAQPQAVAARTWAADRILQQHVRPWREARVLSSKLHPLGRRAARATEEVTSQVLAAVREAKQLSTTATDLIRAVRKTGVGEIAGKQELPALMKKVQDAGRNLNRRGGEKALKEWQAVRKQLQTNMRRLAEGGRTRSSMMELLQRTSDTSARGIDRAIQQHAAFRQKAAAERIIQTETMASFKAEQVLADQKHDFIVGYIWRMNRAARSGFVRRRTSKSGRIIGAKRYSRGGRRRRCVCEELNGKRLSKEAVSGRTARLMAHPHCMCMLEPVMDKRKLNVAQASDFDEFD